MNLEIRKKEIAERLNEIRALAEKEDNLSVLEKFEKETDALQEERNLIDKKLSMKRKFDSAAMFQIRSDAEAIENMEKRGKDLKEGRTVTVTSSNVLLPSHTNAEIGAYPFRDVSTLVDKVRIVNLEGGETYKKSFVKSTDMAGLTAEGDPYTTAEPTFGYATITKVKVTAYAEITEELEKLPALPYSQEVLRGINIALRKKISQQILRGAGSTNTFKGIFANNVEALADNTDIEISTIDDTTLDEIIYAYGGDEEVEGGAALILSKNDLRAFANLRTTEGRKVHIVDYSASTIDGIPYVINSNCLSLIQILRLVLTVWLMGH